MEGVNLMSLVYFPLFGRTYIITGVRMQIMVEFPGVPHKLSRMHMSRDIGEIVIQPSALLIQVIVFDCLPSMNFYLYRHKNNSHIYMYISWNKARQVTAPAVMK